MKDSFSSPYKYGFTTEIETDSIPEGLTEETIYAISAKKNEPSYLLEFRLNAFKRWSKMSPPLWANVQYPPIDLQKICYYSAPKKKEQLNSLDEVDPELIRTFNKLGIPIAEQKRLANVAIDIVFDSVSIGTSFQKELEKAGVIFCSLSEAIQRYPEKIKKYLSSVVPVDDNYFAALNSAVFSDGSFVYIPKGVRAPMELSTYFRINDKKAGQFERTLIIAEEGSYVSYLEGCTAPAYDNHQLHAAVVELIAMDHAEIKYSTVQNWYAGDPKTGLGGIYNFVTKRGLCKGFRSKICWTQVEAGAAITWKYPSCILEGEESMGEFYSVAVTNGKMQADTGSKMTHIGKKTHSTILSKGIAVDESRNSYRGSVTIKAEAMGARNYTQCDSMLVGNRCSANTFPSIEVANRTGEVEHEASTCKMNEEQILYLQTRGISRENGINMIVGGFCKDIILKLPLEFATEAQHLLAMKLESSVG